MMERRIWSASGLQGVLGWATVAGIGASALALGANRPVSWTYLCLWIFALLVLQIANDLRRQLPQSAVRAWPPAVLFLAVLVWATLQILPFSPEEWAHPAWSAVPEAAARIAVDPVQGAHHVMLLAAYASVFWIGLRAGHNANRAAALIRGVAIWGAAIALYGHVTFVFGINPILGERDRFVLSASFVNRNAYATYALIGLLANLSAYLTLVEEGDSRSMRGKYLAGFLERFFDRGWVFALGTLLTASAILLTQSRAGVMAAVIAIIIYALAYPRRGGRRDYYVMGTAAAALIFAAGTMSTGVLRRALADPGEDPRFVVFPAILEALKDRPWLGNGLGGFEEAFLAHLPLDIADLVWDYAHSSYLENAYELGLPAAAVFYAAIGLVVWRLFIGCRTRRRDRVYPALALALAIAVAFHASVDFTLQMPATATLFAFVSGIGWAQSFSRSPPASRRGISLGARTAGSDAPALPTKRADDQRHRTDA